MTASTFYEEIRSLVSRCASGTSISDEKVSEVSLAVFDLINKEMIAAFVKTLSDKSEEFGFPERL